LLADLQSFVVDLAHDGITGEHPDRLPPIVASRLAGLRQQLSHGLLRLRNSLFERL
jgi:hypothetical protein